MSHDSTSTTPPGPRRTERRLRASLALCRRQRLPPQKNRQLALVACIALSTLLRPAVATEPPEPSVAEIQVARRLFQEAKADEQAGRWSAARDKLREALKIKRTPGLLFHLAVCEEELGNYVEALNELGRAEELAEEIVATRVLDLIPARREQIEARVAKLEIRFEGPGGSNGQALAGAEVELDGNVLVPSVYQREIPVNPGQHTVTVRAAGGPDQIQVFSAVAGGSNRLSFELTQTASPAEPPMDEAPTLSSPASTTDQPPASSSTRTAGWIVGGTGVAALGVGAFFGVRAFSQRGQSDDECPTSTSCSPRGVELYEDAKTSAWIANIGVGIGLVGIGIGTYLLLNTSSAQQAAEAIAHRRGWAMDAHLLPRGGQLTLGGTW